MNSKLAVVGIILFTVLVLAGSYFVLVAGAKPEVALATYSANAKEKPKVEAKTLFKDLGVMKVSEDKSADFVLKNIGNKPLQLSNITSSCNCTFAQLIINGKESDLYGMHAPSSFAGEILPGKSATVRVIYRPSIMPVYGVISREVFVETNDPLNQKLAFKIQANVK